MTTLLCCAAFRHTPTVDECGHLAAGMSHHELGRYELYAVNPPLVRLLATLPAHLSGLTTDWRAYDFRSDVRGEFRFGRRLFEMNGAGLLVQLGIGRILCVIFFLTGTLACSNWRDAEDSNSNPLIAAWLWMCSPAILGFGGLICPDVAAAALGAVAVKSLKDWTSHPGAWNLTVFSLAASAACLTKFTWCVLLPVLTLYTLVVAPVKQRVSTLIAHLSVAVLCFILTANCLYGFTGNFRRLGDIRFVSDSFSEPVELSTQRLNRFNRTRLGAVCVPFSEKLLQGIDIQKRDFERGYRSYLMGEWKHGGWWYYYLVGFLVKEPIGFQLMLYVSILHGLYHWKRWTKHSIREWSFIVLPPLLIFGLVSSQTGFNHHMRYVLPAYPFLFIIAARTVTLGKFWKWFSYGCLTWQAVAVLWFAPHWMSYFNEAAGGPQKGHDWLVDSNIDWGQDILGLQWWQNEHPEIDLQAALFTGFDPADIGLKFRLPAPYLEGQPDVVSKDGLRGPQAGWYAVSVCQLKGHSFNVPVGNGDWTWSNGHFTYFMDHFEPVDMIGYSIYIYHITEQQAAEVRERLREAEVEAATSQGSGLEQGA